MAMIEEKNNKKIRLRLFKESGTKMP